MRQQLWIREIFVDLVKLFWRILQFSTLRAGVYFILGGAMCGGAWNAIIGIDLLAQIIGIDEDLFPYQPERFIGLSIITGVAMGFIGILHGFLRAIAPHGVPRDAIW